MASQLEFREPVWCHDCGTYSFLDEWGNSSIGVEDVCPVCASIFPAAKSGPLSHAFPCDAKGVVVAEVEAAVEHLCVY